MPGDASTLSFRPMKHRDNFHAVLVNSDDQVIVRDLLDELVPDEVKARIVAAFNRHVDEYNVRAEEISKRKL
jgi:hypothetical protein